MNVLKVYKMINLDYPHKMTPKEKEHFLKMWESSVPRLMDPIPNGFIIYGTGGETDKI